MKNFLKKSVSVFLTIAMPFSFAACNNQKSETEETEETEETGEKPTVIIQTGDDQKGVGSAEVDVSKLSTELCNLLKNKGFQEKDVLKIIKILYGETEDLNASSIDFCKLKLIFQNIIKELLNNSKFVKDYLFSNDNLGAIYDEFLELLTSANQNERVTIDAVYAWLNKVYTDDKILNVNKLWLIEFLYESLYDLGIYNEGVDPIEAAVNNLLNIFFNPALFWERIETPTTTRATKPAKPEKSYREDVVDNIISGGNIDNGKPIDKGGAPVKGGSSGKDGSSGEGGSSGKGDILREESTTRIVTEEFTDKISEEGTSEWVKEDGGKVIEESSVEGVTGVSVGTERYVNKYDRYCVLLLKHEEQTACIVSHDCVIYIDYNKITKKLGIAKTKSPKLHAA